MMTLTSSQGHQGHQYIEAYSSSYSQKEEDKTGQRNKQFGLSFQDGWRGLTGFMRSLRTLIGVSDMEE